RGRAPARRAGARRRGVPGTVPERHGDRAARELSTPHANALTPVIARPTGRGTCRRPIVAYTNPSTWRSASRRAASETEWSRSERSMVITRRSEERRVGKEGRWRGERASGGAVGRTRRRE